MFLSPTNLPRILGHRGQALHENTREAFAAALRDGADIIETDIHCSKDGVAVIFHDDTLLRIAGIPQKVSDLNFSELEKLNVGLWSLEQALTEFRTAKFNIDFKAAAAIVPGVEAIRKCQAQDRVLATSFSDARLNRVHQIAPELVRSLPGVRVFLMRMFPFLCRSLAKGFVAAQIPVRFGRFTLATESFIRALKAAGLEVHFWVVNDLAEVDRLLAIGADGFVTDEPAKLVKHLRKA